MIEPKELRKIVRFCQKNGIIKFKSGDFEIEIDHESLEKKFPMPERTAPEPGVPQSTPAPDAFPPWESLTPEQKLLWSSTPDLPTT